MGFYGFSAAHRVWVFAACRSRWKKPLEDKAAQDFWVCGENLPAAVRIAVIAMELLLTFQHYPGLAEAKELASGWLRSAEDSKSGQPNKGQGRDSDKKGGKREKDWQKCEFAV